MITYTPLYETLRERHLSVYDLQRMVDNYELKKTLDAHRYINLGILERICTVLDCDVQDVIAHWNGEQHFEERHNVLYESIDWDKFREIAGEPDSKLSKKMGFSRTYFYQITRRETVSSRVVDKIIRGLNRNGIKCRPEDILKENTND